MAMSPQLQDLEAIHDRLGLAYGQIAAALGADESSLHRWRAGEARPRAVYLRRIEALREFETELLDAMNAGAARDWLTRAVPALAGRRPVDLLCEGRIEPLTRLLIRLNLGSAA